MKDATASWGRTLTEQADRHGRFFFNVAFGILRDAAAAEDACQQALLKAWQQQEAIREAERIRGWLTRVVVNESLQQLRKRKREREVLAQHTPTGAGAPPGGSLKEPGDGLAVRESVWRALNELPEATRTVVVLRLINGFSGNEVKAMLDCSASEVSRRLHAGMEQLRGIFTREECEP